jgi:hypothetical protein
MLLAAAFVLNLSMASEVEIAGLVRPLVVAVAAAGVLTLLGWAVFRNRWDGGLAATVVVLLIISQLPVYRGWEAVTTAFGPGAALIAFAILFAGLMALPGFMLVRARASRRPMRRPSPAFLNGFSAVLVGVVVLSYALPHTPTILGRLTEPQPSVAVSPPATPPDIFILLLDAYPDDDLLAHRFNIDNGPFLGELDEMGFDVAADSRSNYTLTGLTLASMFQMRYLDDVPEVSPHIGQPGGHHDLLRYAANSGAAFAALRAAGYQIIASAPDHEHVPLRGAADRYLDHGELEDIERELLKRTWLLDLLNPLTPDLFTRQLRDRIVHAFDDTDALAAEKHDRPIFAFMHVPAPHVPLVVDAQGNPNGLPSRQFDAASPPRIELGGSEFRAAYAAELTYINQRTLEAAEALLSARDGMQPVVVIMSDHGYIHDEANGPIADRFGNLFAAFTPGAPDLLAGGVTPVNLLPTLFDHYLGTDLGRSPDQFFVSPDPFNPLLMTQVGEQDLQ